MPTTSHARQLMNDVINVGRWRSDEDFPIAPQGAKPKRQLLAPELAPRGYLYGGHRYLFKQPAGPWAQQIWSEVIAYELAKHLGVSVPPAFLAVDETSGSPGVLVEFFYGYPGEARSSRFVHGVDALQAAGLGFATKCGSLKENIQVCRLHRVLGWRRWWGQTLAFDAVIGNTDRHAENWGFLVDPIAPEPLFSMAPAFDNGTSLGYLVRDDDLARQREPTAFDRFLRNGRHHYAWLSDQRRGAGFPELCHQFVSVYGAAGDAMESAIQLTDSQIEDVLQWCVAFDFPVPFTPERAEFVAAMVKARRDALARAIGA